jgi:hypothetical protein
MPDDAAKPAEVQRLPHRTADVGCAPRAVQFGPGRQQRLQHAHQGDEHADEDRRADRQRGQRLLRIAAGDDGVGDAERHGGQLAGQHRAGVAGAMIPRSLHGVALDTAGGCRWRCRAPHRWWRPGPLAWSSGANDGCSSCGITSSQGQASVVARGLAQLELAVVAQGRDVRPRSAERLHAAGASSLRSEAVRPRCVAAA